MGFSLPYFTQNYTSVWVNINGYLAFGTLGGSGSTWPITAPSPSNIISGYNMDLKTLRCGTMSTRTIADSLTLNSIGAEINSLLKPYPAFNPTNAFVVTWNQVCACYHCSSILSTVTFQILISTNGQQTFLTLNYGNLDFAPYANGIFYQYVNSNNVLVQTVLASTSLQYSSNVGLSGKWIYPWFNGN